MLTCTYPAFDGSMVLFQDVVEILHRSMSTVLLQNTVSFELNDGWRISSVLVGTYYPPRAGRIIKGRRKPPLLISLASLTTGADLAKYSGT